MADTCTITITSEVQTEVTDAKGIITGYKWAPGTASKEQLVRVVAKMTGTCAAHIKLSFESNRSTVDVRKFALVDIRQTPPAPGPNICTKCKEATFWATSINGLIGDPAPEVTFTAAADCAPCDCDANPSSNTAQVKQAFA